MTPTQKIVAELGNQARLLGFDSFGVTSSQHKPGTAEGLREYVDRKFHGSMSWMVETLERRSSPTALWPDARSVIVVAINYGPETNPLEQLDRKTEGAISVYARNRDYHDVVKGRLKTLASKLHSMAAQKDLDCQVKVFVDTAPVMEKPLAQQAGLGWQGKHTNLVSREFGSWLFLGSIFTNLDLPMTEPGHDNCGSCANCLDICPTDAFPAPYKLDARRCISYLTIEHKGPIPEEFRKPMGNRIYGCDDCLAVCPWNKFASISQETKLAAPVAPRDQGLGRLLRLDDAAFRQYFSGSPIKRIGRLRFIRNCLIAAGNSEDVELLAAVQPHCSDESDIVRDAAFWAVRQLNGSIK